MCGEYTDYTLSHLHPGAQFWVGSSRNWSVFLERPNTGRHEKAPVCCPCSRLAALHGAPQTRDLCNVMIIMFKLIVMEFRCIWYLSITDKNSMLNIDCHIVGIIIFFTFSLAIMF